MHVLGHAHRGQGILDLNNIDIQVLIRNVISDYCHENGMSNYTRKQVSLKRHFLKEKKKKKKKMCKSQP